MITSTEARKLLDLAARQVFPSILPSRLHEARNALLQHLNMSIEDFGYYPGGQPKFEGYCSQVVKSLKTSGEMKTKGWTWIWCGDQAPMVEPMVEPVEPVEPTPPVNMTMLDLDLFEEDTLPPSLYDLGCEDTVIRLVASTPCFGKVLQSDDVCQRCPLFDLCCEKKGEVSKAKKEAREAKAEALEVASQAGYDLKGLKIPKSARLHDSYEIEAKGDTFCIASGSPILKGEKAAIIPSWGAVKPIIVEALKAIEI